MKVKNVQRERERWKNFESIYHWNSWGKRSSKWRGICNQKFLNYLWQVRNDVTTLVPVKFVWLGLISPSNVLFDSWVAVPTSTPLSIARQVLRDKTLQKPRPLWKHEEKKQNETHVLIYLFQRLLFFSYLQYHDGSLSFPTELAAVILHKLLQGVLTQKAVPILNKSFSYLVQGLWH